jgi:acyl carrier protein
LAAAQSLNLLTPEGELASPLDSIDMVNLVVELEGLLGHSLLPEAVAPEHFASVAALVEIVEATR